MKKNVIHYGLGREYLSNWGLKEALREIYQNFIDYGTYVEEIVNNKDNVTVTVSNDWKPESLDFLRIGNSKKVGEQAIGKHGEGIKMAFLILLREGLFSKIYTPFYTIEPSWYNDKEVGECFCLLYKDNVDIHDGFSISFDCPLSVYEQFKFNLITKDDIIYDDKYWGQIVDKPKGSVYSGGLFVAQIDNLSNAYNISPRFLPLDRDRSVPRSFDVNYAASKINEGWGKYNVEDLSMSDTTYITKVPIEIKERITPVIVGNSIQFKHTDASGKDVVISNSNVKDALITDSFFTAGIKKLKQFLAKQLGLYDLLIEFRDKHVHDTEALMDFDMILNKVDANHIASEKNDELLHF